MKKYEFRICLANALNVNEKIEKLQNEDWELAGKISVTQSERWGGVPQILIPFKREIITAFSFNNGTIEEGEEYAEASAQCHKCKKYYETS